MNCAILRTLYLRSNGDIPCHDDAGEEILLGRVDAQGADWSIGRVLAAEPYQTIRNALRDGRAPWPGTCDRCAWLRPDETASDLLARKVVTVFQVEPSLACNLRCPCCSQAAQIATRPPPHRMPLAVFEAALRSLVDDGFSVREIEYCGQGEPMSHPGLHAFISLARMLLPTTQQRLITNGTFDHARLGPAGPLDEIIVSCDGARQDSYGQYRIGGRLDKVLAFMRDVPRAVDGRRQSVVWKYILFEFNDSDEELIEAQTLAQSLKVDVLLFVVTHSRFKSLRFTADNAHELPITWPNARVSATPVQLRGARALAPATHVGWPRTAPGGGVVLMLDGAMITGPDSLRLHGWMVCRDPGARLRLRHNGHIVSETLLNDPRPDVRAEFPAHAEGNLGFAIDGRTGPTDGSAHVIRADVLSSSGHVIASFAREFRDA